MYVYIICAGAPCKVRVVSCARMLSETISCVISGKVRERETETETETETERERERERDREREREREVPCVISC